MACFLFTRTWRGCVVRRAGGAAFAVEFSGGRPLAVSASNQIAGFCYDTAGNLQAQSAPPCPSPTYAYNAENQLTSTAGVTYTYDGDGKRVKKSNGKLYWYGTGSDALDESDASGNITDEFIFFGGKRIARRNVSSGNIY